METLVFQVNNQTDFELLTSLTERIGIKRVENSDLEVLDFFNDKKFRLELAIFLFKAEKMSLGKASEFAGLHKIEFQKHLKNRKIEIHYGVDELNEDLDNLENL